MHKIQETCPPPEPRRDVSRQEVAMITIGVDAHKRVHAAVALDEAGREVARWRGPNSADGWAALGRWAEALGAPRRWGIEGAGGYGRGLAQRAVAHGAEVYEVNARWTAAGRRRARRRDKNDWRDAAAVAEVVRKEAPALPAVAPEDETAALALLVAERDELVAEVTRLRNQLHHLLGQLDPEYADHLPSLRSKAGVAALEAYATDAASPVQQQRAAAVRRLAQRLRLAAEQGGALTAEIRALAAPRYAPLTAIVGVDLLTAAALAGLLGPGRRFASDAALATYAGVAPCEASSAERVRHRLNRGGNRRLNAVLHRVAVSQARHSPEARAYLERRQREGKTRREALRALKRFICRAVWRRWQECLAAPPAAADRAA
jgi:transposase